MGGGAGFVGNGVFVVPESNVQGGDRETGEHCGMLLVIYCNVMPVLFELRGTRGLLGESGASESGAGAVASAVVT